MAVKRFIPLALLCWLGAVVVVSSFRVATLPQAAGRRDCYYRSASTGTPTTTSTCCAATKTSSGSVDTSFMWNRGLNFGKGQFKFYDGFEKWMSVFPEEDRLAYPEVFAYPPGVYEVKLNKPLGIVFEEIEQRSGVYVKSLVDGGNAAKNGIIQSGDVLIGITAVKVVGAKYERRLIPARKFDFDTMVGAISSNDARYGCDDVILAFERPGVAVSEDVDTFMAFFEPPFDNPWKQQQ
jgi:PDZ domain